LLFGVFCSEKSFAAKRKIAGAISLWRNHLIPYFDLVCLGMKLCEFILVLQK